MNREVRTVSTHDLFPIIEELLAQNRQSIFTVKGRSMLPFIGDNRDQVMLEKRDFTKLKKGDIILFKYDWGKYVLHRIYNVSESGYQTIGDGLISFDEWISPDQVKGVVVKIIRKGREIDCNLKIWKFIFYIWRILLPIRGTLLSIYSKLSSIKRKIFKLHK